MELADRLGIDQTPGHFADSPSFHPVNTSREGIFVCGAFAGPKDIPQSVVEASSAAAEAGAILKEARNTLTRAETFPEERVIAGERPPPPPPPPPELVSLYASAASTSVAWWMFLSSGIMRHRFPMWRM